MSETPETAECETEMSLKFPQTYEVCKATTESALVQFNPLEGSEPNLDMMDTNMPKLDLICDAKQKRWTINIRKLSAVEIDFLSGPKLLPSLQMAGNLVPDLYNDETEQEDVATGNNTLASAPQVESSQEQNALPTNGEVAGPSVNNSSESIPQSTLNTNPLIRISNNTIDNNNNDTKNK